MAATSFKKGSGKDELAKRIRESALATLAVVDTQHNYILEGSTSTDIKLTEEGEKLVASMDKCILETAGTIGDAIAGIKASEVKKTDSLLIYDEDGEANYRVPFSAIA